MDEEELLLHTFRTNEHIPIPGEQLQNLLRHKNRLLAENEKLKKEYQELARALTLVKQQLTIQAYDKRVANLNLYA